MITRIGSQNRELLVESGYSLVKLNKNEAVLRDKATGRLELWQRNNHHSGYVIEIQGIGYEFVRGK